MPFSNPVVGGTALVRAAIKSPNYVAGSQGWTINRDGSAEFSGVTMRGNLTLVGTSGRQLALTVDNSGIPGIHYTDTAAAGKSGDIFAQAQLGTVVLILSSGSVLNLGSQLTQPTLQLGPRVATLGILEPGTGAIHGGNLALLEQRSAIEYWDPNPVPAAKLNSVELNKDNVLVQKPMIVTGETWHTPVLTAPFINVAAGNVQYRLLPNGDVELRGGANYNSAPPVGGFPIFTLPVGYRPTMQDEYAIARQGVYTTGKVVIGTDGVVTYWVNDSVATPQLGGVHFSTLA